MATPMQAAVVSIWGEPPTYKSITLDAPTPTQLRIKVLAAAIHQVVRSRATGKHYSASALPHIPGVDGVGTVTTTGETVYFIALYAPTGPFAQYINVEKDDVFTLPEGADPALVAALMNPAMSSWMALRCRVTISTAVPFSVFVLGATGVSGLTAVQVAKSLGAETVVGAGRNTAALESAEILGLDTAISLGDETSFAAAAEVDIVLDYLWGSVASQAMVSMLKARCNRNKALQWVEIGSAAGQDLSLPSAALRSANLHLLGCGPGAWSMDELRKEMPELLSALVKSGMKQSVRVEKLENVETVWNSPASERIVFEP